MTAKDNNPRLCLLDETKLCNDCGECDRCDLDPSKICDNCCKCLAIEEDEEDFRTVTIDGRTGASAAVHSKANSAFVAKKVQDKLDLAFSDANEQPEELTPELLAYWEQKLLEYGEAPADDGLGEIRVSTRVPVSGVRKKRER